MHTSPAVSALLDRLGLAIGPYQVEIIDIHEAEKAYIHHSSVPVAVTGYALISPSFAKGRFPKLSFVDLIHKRPAMDEVEAHALAAVCGVEIDSEAWSDPESFGTHLWEVIKRYDLRLFFQCIDRPYGSRGKHYLMRPVGFNWTDPDHPEIPGALAKWRSDYRKLPPYRQLLVASILQLYFQSDDHYWMVRVPKNWHAAEGVEILKGNGALQDWAKLYALYPGW